MGWGRKKVTFDEKRSRFKSEISIKCYKLADSLGLNIDIESSPLNSNLWNIYFKPTFEDRMTDVRDEMLIQPELKIKPKQSAAVQQESKEEKEKRHRRTRAEMEADKVKETVEVKP